MEISKPSWVPHVEHNSSSYELLVLLHHCDKGPIIRNLQQVENDPKSYMSNLH